MHLFGLRSILKGRDRREVSKAKTVAAVVGLFAVVRRILI